MGRLWNIAFPDYQESVTTGQMHRRTDRKTDRQTLDEVISTFYAPLCFAGDTKMTNFRNYKLPFCPISFSTSQQMSWSEAVRKMTYAYITVQSFSRTCSLQTMNVLKSHLARKCWSIHRSMYTRQNKLRVTCVLPALLQHGVLKIWFFYKICRFKWWIISSDETISNTKTLKCSIKSMESMFNLRPLSEKMENCENYIFVPNSKNLEFIKLLI